MCEDNLDMSTSIRNISQHLADISPLLTEGDIRFVLYTRKLSPDIPLMDLSERDVDLAVAEAYLKLCDLPASGSTSKDVDGSWSHTEGSCSVSKENLRQWYGRYVELRQKWGEPILRKSTIKVHSTGMKLWRK